MKDFVSFEEMHDKALKRPGYKEAYEKEMARYAAKAARIRAALMSKKSRKKTVVS